MSKPNVFIVESNRPEERRLREGEILQGLLRMDGKASRYLYVFGKRGLEKALREFKESEYRYLHLACHGSKKSIFTSQDKIRFEEFGKIARPFLNRRRLFISACWAVRDSLAKEIFSESGCISLIGPNFPIYFGDAALAWATFYHLMSDADRKGMAGSNIPPILRKINGTFDVPFTFYASSKVTGFGYRKVRWDV